MEASMNMMLDLGRLGPSCVRTGVPAGDGQALTIRVAQGFDDLLKAVAVRAAIFMGEQNCPYAEEFDGNDLAGTTLLALMDEEPVAAMRIRYFGDCAKLERLAVMKPWRARVFDVTLPMAKYAIAFVRRKGFTRVYGHALPEVVRLWARLGCRPTDRRVTFSGLDFIVVVGEFPPLPDALSHRDDPLVLVRPEGDWDRTGVLDRSSAQGRDSCPTIAAE
jgi:predicted GNAT family N-acyltransferase